MGRNISYPDGSTLTSTALTGSPNGGQIGAIFQPLVLAMLGYTVSETSPLVRLSWPTQGQPSQLIGDDICYLAFILKNDPYDKIRDRAEEPATDPYCEEEWAYTRVWGVKFCAIGPNSFDNLRAIRSALMQDYFTAQLALNNLFPVSEIPEVIHAPEVFNGQWWERSDLDLDLYEYVLETIQRQTVLSVETIVEIASGEVADVTTTA